MKEGGDGEWYLTGAADCNNGTTHAPAVGIACASPAHQPTVPPVCRTSVQPVRRALIISGGASRHNCMFNSKKTQLQLENKQFLKAAYRNLKLLGMS